MADYLGRWADLNCDGEVDDFEEFVALENLDSDEEDFDDEEEEKEVQRNILDEYGLDYDELEWMDEDERREALEDAGLDPDDFDFY